MTLTKHPLALFVVATMAATSLVPATTASATEGDGTTMAASYALDALASDRPLTQGARASGLAEGLTLNQEPAATAEVSASCYELETGDPAGDDGDGIADVGLFVLGYDCDNAGWAYDLYTYDQWVEADDLFQVVYLADVDVKTSTGCAGFERAFVIDAASPDAGFRQAEVLLVVYGGGCTGEVSVESLGFVDLALAHTDFLGFTFSDALLNDYDQTMRGAVYFESWSDPSGAGDATDVLGGDACPFNCYKLAAGFGLSVAKMFRYGTTKSETFVGDWNNDGIDTIGVRIGNEFFLSNSQSGGRSSDHRFKFGSVTDEVIVGDWNNDGIDTVGVRRGNEFFLVNSFAGGKRNDENFKFGSAGDEVIIGDWNADGLDTIGVRKGNDYYLLDTFGGGKKADQQFRYGSVTDPVVVGDWNGDGHDTLGVRKGRQWYLSDNPASGSSRKPFPFGQVSDLPFAGDWDGDGVDTPGVRT